jgi:membrane dipeptidase
MLRISARSTGARLWWTHCARLLTAAQKAEFDADIARRKKLGIGAPGEDRYPYVPDLNGPDHMQIIATELARRGQPSSVSEKVLGANFVRVSGEIWGTA